MPTNITILSRLNDGAFGKYPAYYRKRVKALAEALEAKKITVDEWLIAMRHEIEELHMAAYMIGRGKEHQLDEKDLAVIAAIVAAQFAFLVNWARQLQAVEAVKASVIESRANLYLNAADSTTMRGQAAQLGLPEIPMPRNGTTQCLNQCLCAWRIEQLEGEGNWDCYWILGEPETNHCETCPNRANAWYPLRIRAGEITPPLDYNDPRLFYGH